MPGHRPFSELRDKIEADPVRAARLAATERELAAEQLTYDHILDDVRRARTYTREQLARALGVSQAQVAHIEHQTDLYLSTLQSYLAAMGGELEFVAHFGDTRLPLSLADFLSTEDAAADSALAAAATPGASS